MRFIILALTLVFTVANTQPTIQNFVQQENYEQAFELAQDKAAKGEGKAHDWLGWFYERGYGTEADLAKAEKHYRMASDLDQGHASWKLGVLIDSGAIKGELREAVAFFQKAADAGFIDGFVSLAVMQAQGRGTPENFEGALMNYMGAAQLGSAHAAQGVGVMLMIGQGVEKNVPEAAAWFLFSAARGSQTGEDNFRYTIDEMENPDLISIAKRAKEIADEMGFPVNITIIEDEVQWSKPAE